MLNYKEFLNENSGIKYKVSNNEDITEISALLDNNVIGKLIIEVLLDAYNYEFDDVFTEEEFNEHFPNDIIVKIQHINVDDDFKNQGIATELMKRGLKLMKKRGYTQFYLNASPMGFSGLRTNDLVNFYKKFGFEEILNQGKNVLMKMILK